jgi:hypothetical protein
MSSADTSTVQANPQPQPRARFTITLPGSKWDIAYYGIVEFLRVHRVWRSAVATLGVLTLVLLVAGFLVTVPGVPTGSTLVFLFIAPSLLWMATVSGPSFQLVFPAAKASAEREIAEKQFDESKTPEDALNLDFKRLSEYYAINQSQARSSFRWAKFSMLVGFATIIAGVWLFYFRPTQPDKFMSTISAATGCVINLVSGLFLRLHSQTQNRALHYYEPLARLQRLSLAIRLVDAHQDPSEQTQARNLVIQELLAGSRAQTIAR